MRFGGRGRAGGCLYDYKLGIACRGRKTSSSARTTVKQVVTASPKEITVLWPGRSKDWPVAKWLIDDMIPEHTTGLIVGESGAGKTFVALHLAGSLAVGKPFFGKKINARGGTVYVCAEGSFSIHDRLRAEFSGSISPHLKSDAGRGRNRISRICQFRCSPAFAISTMTITSMK